jgi:hypothetical protein
MPTHTDAVKFAWTEENVAELLRLHALGWTGTEIAIELAAPSRFAVIGKLNRLRIAAGYVPQKRQPEQPTNGNSIKKGKAYVARRREILAAKGHPHLDRPPVALLDLQHDHCRWPVTERPPHMFCGASKWGGSSYCEHHTARAWRDRS